jgi:DNA-binding SARP family transcriptional activator
MGLFWPDHSEERAENNLSLAVMNLRRILREEGAGADFIVQQAGCYYLKQDGLWLDVEEFERAALLGLRLEDQGETTAAIQALDEAIAVYGGDLLPAEPYEEWTLSPRRELQDRFVQTLRARARIARSVSDYNSAIRLTQRLLDLEPADEEWHRRLIEDYLAKGERSRAIAQMESCRQALRRHLDVEPSPETQKLFERLLHT